MADDEVSASAQIDQRITELGDWRGETLSQVREVIRRSVPDVVEQWKWAKATSPGTPVWSCGGILCTGETYRDVVKLTFPKGASLADPDALFNASLAGNARRAIDIREPDQVDEVALAGLVRAAAALNAAGKRPAGRAGPAQV